MHQPRKEVLHDLYSRHVSGKDEKENKCQQQGIINLREGLSVHKKEHRRDDRESHPIGDAAEHDRDRESEKHEIQRNPQLRKGRRFLWLRNNGSTLISQLLNTVLFNVGAFAGTYDAATLVAICAVGYVIYVVTSLLDTPFIYAARKMKEHGMIPSSAGAEQ